MADYTNNAQQRIIHLIEFLAGNEHEGLPLKDIADHLETSTTAAFRDLKNLEETGWGMQLENTNWVMTPKATEPLKAISTNTRRLLSEINRINKEYLGETE